MKLEEKSILTNLCDRIHFGESIDVDRIEALESLYYEVRKLIKYIPNESKFIDSLSEAEQEIFEKTTWSKFDKF